MRAEVTSLHEQYDAREMKYVEDALKYGEDVERYRALLEEAHSQVMQQNGQGHMMELFKAENKKLRTQNA